MRRKRSTGAAGLLRQAVPPVWRFARWPKSPAGWKPRMTSPAQYMPEPRAVAESVYREEAGKIIATLIRLSGSFDLAEEALQEALAAALETWPERGVPDKPAAWITSTAQRRLIDAVRRDSTRRNKATAL